VVDLDARPAPTPFSERTGLLGVRVMEATNICLFRLSKGRVGGTIFGAPVVLLTTSGRTTGIRRTKPLLALQDGDAWIVAGSRGGTSKNPDWYENLVAFHQRADLAAPVVECAGDHRVAVRSTVLRGRERDEWWSRLVAVYPKFDAYQQRAPHREIPIVRLTPTTH
jgi:deazaflavin-dependent oxidoreductase (nitroreductase family)